MATTPDNSHFLSFFTPLLKSNLFASGVATIAAPTVAVIIFVLIALLIADCEFSNQWSWSIFALRKVAYTGAIIVYGYISISATQFFILKMTFFLSVMVTIWLVITGALLFSIRAFASGQAETISMANGAISSSILMLAIITSFAIVCPGLLLLQPIHIWRVARAQRGAMTPRQKFRGWLRLPCHMCFLMHCSALPTSVQSVIRTWRLHICSNFPIPVLVNTSSNWPCCCNFTVAHVNR